MYQEIHHSLQLADPNQPAQKHTVKLCTCNKCHKHSTDICFYVPFCIIFICLGIIQIISGIFYFITTPVIKLILNVAIGCWVSVFYRSISILFENRFLMNFVVDFLFLAFHLGPQAILCGISGSMVACVCPSTPRKHEFLLYCSLSILVLNLINLILLEFGQVRDIFNEHVQKLLSKEYDLLESENGKFLLFFPLEIPIVKYKR